MKSRETITADEQGRNHTSPSTETPRETSENTVKCHQSSYFRWTQNHLSTCATRTSTQATEQVKWICDAIRFHQAAHVWCQEAAHTQDVWSPWTTDAAPASLRPLCLVENERMRRERSRLQSHIQYIDCDIRLLHNDTMSNMFVYILAAFCSFLFQYNNWIKP